MQLVQARADTTALQNSVRYIDLDSTHRNRSESPNSTDFTARSGVSPPAPHEPEDLVLDGLPVHTFGPNTTHTFDTTLLSGSVNGAFLSTPLDHDITGRLLTVHAVASAASTIIARYDPVTSYAAFVTPLPEVLTDISATVSIPTGNMQVYVKLPPSLYTSVVGMALVGVAPPVSGQGQGFTRRITAYDSARCMLTLDSELPDTDLHVYEIVRDPASTSYIPVAHHPGQASTSVILDSAQKVTPGMYLRFTGYTWAVDPSGTSSPGPWFDFTRRITRVDGNTVHFTPSFGMDTGPLDLAVQALAPRDNCARGSRNVACTSLAPGMYEIELTSLVLPNTPVRSERGGSLNQHSHLYLEFGNVTPAFGRTVSAFVSNNPHTTRALFKVHVLDVQLPSNSSFLKAASPMKHRVRLDPHGDLSFRLLLPTGEPLCWSTDDNMPPYAPNPDLRVSATFSLRRLS